MAHGDNDVGAVGCESLAVGRVGCRELEGVMVLASGRVRYNEWKGGKSLASGRVRYDELEVNLRLGKCVLERDVIPPSWKKCLARRRNQVPRHFSRKEESCPPSKNKKKVSGRVRCNELEVKMSLASGRVHCRER